MFVTQLAKFISFYLLLNSHNLLASPPDCTDYYYVKRPIVGSLVLHEYIGIDDERAQVSGLPKANSDLIFFKKFLDDPAQQATGLIQKSSLEFFGRACGGKRLRALKTAHERSKAWEDAFASWTIYLLRMGATPLMGKPCRKAALDLVHHLEPWLTSL